MDISFYSFCEARNKGYSSKTAIKTQPSKVVVVGGFVPEDINFTEAADAGVAKTPITFDENDVKFLSQFPYTKWREILQWRYNEGLYKYLTGQIKDGDSFTVSSIGRGLPTTVKSVIYYYEPLVKKLVEDRANGGYGYDLPTKDGDWKKLVDKDPQAGDVTLYGSRNWTPPRLRAIGPVLDAWLRGCTQGILAESEIKPNQYTLSNMPRGGVAPKKNYLDVDYLGRIVNHSQGVVVPCINKDSLPEIASHDHVKATNEHDGTLLFHFEGFNGEYAMPKLFGGKLFLAPYNKIQGSANDWITNSFTDASKRLRGYGGREKYLAYLQEHMEMLFASYPTLRNQKILDMQELEKIAGSNVYYQNVKMATTQIHDMRPASKSPQALETISPATRNQQELRDVDSTGKAKSPAKISTIGGTSSNYYTVQHQPVSSQQLAALGINAKEYENILNDFFLGDLTSRTQTISLSGGQPITHSLTYGTVKLPNGTETESPVTESFKKAVQSYSNAPIFSYLKPAQFEEVILNAYNLLMDKSTKGNLYDHLFVDTAGYSAFFNFVKALLDNVTLSNKNNIIQTIRTQILSSPNKEKLTELWHVTAKFIKEQVADRVGSYLQQKDITGTARPRSDRNRGGESNYDVLSGDDRQSAGVTDIAGLTASQKVAGRDEKTLPGRTTGVHTSPTDLQAQHKTPIAQPVATTQHVMSDKEVDDAIKFLQSGMATPDIINRFAKIAKSNPEIMKKVQQTDTKLALQLAR